MKPQPLLHLIEPHERAMVEDPLEVEPRRFPSWPVIGLIAGSLVLIGGWLALVGYVAWVMWKGM